MSYSGVVASLERLYESAVMAPHEFDVALAAEDLFETVPDREVAKRIRRAMRVAVKLAGFWQGRSDDEPDWVRRVDEASGAPAWRPLLEVAQLGLDANPSADLFDLVKRLFPVVHYERWMDGMGFEEWQESG
ncbi:MAG: hypothetical protein KJN71_02250 [Acidimicrobiia bacterium]|nr:hypothetical protein [Acidimicrobiia bacterium]NNC75803.1 hypothetical protein [Acidimicrobiia bacterium]